MICDLRDMGYVGSMGFMGVVGVMGVVGEMRSVGYPSEKSRLDFFSSAFGYGSYTAVV